MRSNTGRTAASSRASPARTTDDTSSASRSEWGPRAILAGWLVTLLGIAGYIVAMSRAGENAGILDGLLGQGPLSWISCALMAAGVVIWFIGNCACLQDLADSPGCSED